MFNLTSPLNESATQVSHYDSDRSPPSEFSSYDYIVIGGGTSGSVLSNSLSSNPENEVLVLEAGPRANFAVSIPLIANIRAYDPRFGFQLSTVPQKNLENRRVETFSGKILGGTSAVNASVFTKSCHEELRSWVSDHGCKTWSPEEMQPFIDRPLQNEQSSSKHQIGPLETRGMPAHVPSFSQRWLKALDRVGNTNFENPHWNSEEGPIGIGSFKPRFTVSKKGWKSHAGNSFLPDEVLRNRSNLRVCTECRVDRLHLERDETGELVAKGVWIKDLKGHSFFVRCSKEIILSAGAFHTPPILLRSGIGPSKDLSDLSIPIQLDSPRIGKGLSDHIGVILHFLGPYSESTLKIQDGFLSTLYEGAKNSLDFLLFGKGLFTSPGFVEVISYLKSSQIEIDKDKTEMKLKFSNPYTTIPDIEIIFSTHWMEFQCRRFPGLNATTTKPKKGVFGIFIILTSPTKTDSSYVKLNSRDVFDPPLIDPSFFENPEDLEKLLKAVKLIMFLIGKLNQEEEWEIEPADCPGFDWGSGEYEFEGMEKLKKKGSFHGFNEIPDEVYRSYIRQKATAIYHPSSSCQMGRTSTDPIDPTNFKLRNVNGLRVCDASIFPHVPSTHPQSLVYASAEKLGEILLKER